MKLTYLLGILLLSFTAVKAQVSAFTPTIRFTSSYYSFKKGIDLTSEIDTLCTVGKVWIDLDNKTISDPESIERPLGVFPIKSVSYDAANRMYRLDAEDPYMKHKFLYFNVKLDGDDNIIYVKKVKRYKGGDSRGDTSFSTFTNSLMDIEFSVNSKRMKENLNLPSDSAENSKQYNAVLDAPYIEQETKLEMRNGYVSWTEGKGRDIKYHSYHVDEVRIKNEEGATKGFELICYITPFRFYAIRKVKTRRLVVRNQYGWVDVIMILKIEDRKRTAISIIQD
jgi:hypothetical protein